MSKVSRRALLGGLSSVAVAAAAPASAWLRVKPPPDCTGYPTFTCAPPPVAQYLTPGPNYNGTAGSGYSAAQMQYLNDLDSTGTPLAVGSTYAASAVRGPSNPYFARPEHGYFARLATYEQDNPTTHAVVVAPVVNTDGKIAATLHVVSPATTDELFGNAKVGQVDLVVQWLAFAAGPDGLVGGIDHTNVYVEGKVFTFPASAMQAIAIPNADGTTLYAPGYQATLRGIDFTVGNALDIYFEAVPSLSGIGTRVVGPWRVHRKDDWDEYFYVDPTLSTDNAAANTYKTAAGAVSYVGNKSAYKAPYVNGQGSPYSPGGAVSPKTAFVKISYVNDTQPGSGDLTGEDLTVGYSNLYRNTYNLRGKILLDANGHNVTHCNSTFTDVNYKINNLEVAGIRLDTKNMYTIHKPANQPDAPKRLIVFRGCEFMTSDPNKSQASPPFGAAEYLDRRTTQVFNNNSVALIGCNIHDCALSDIRVPVAIGNVATNLCYDAFDIFTGAPCLILGNKMKNISGLDMIRPRQAFGISYTGPGTGTFSLSFSGNTTLTLEVDSGSGPVAVATFVSAGSEQGSATVNGTAYTGIFTCQEAADAINAFGATAAGAGWSATPATGPGTRYKFKYASPLNGTKPSINVSHVSLTQAIGTAIDIHCDFGQCNNANPLENIQVISNVLTQGCVQPISPLAQVKPAQSFNWHSILNMLENDMGALEIATEYSQMNGSHAHFLMAHNTWPSGGIFLSNSYGTDTVRGIVLDETSRFVNNVVDSFILSASGSNPVLGPSTTILALIKRNVINETFGTQPTLNSYGVAAISDNIDLGANSSTPQNRLSNANTADFPALADSPLLNGNVSNFDLPNFKPAAGGKLRLTANLRAPEVPFDIFGNKYSALDMVGAVSLAA